jgi:glucose/arabinose dehydrogenase
MWDGCRAVPSVDSVAPTAAPGRPLRYLALAGLVALLGTLFALATRTGSASADPPTASAVQIASYTWPVYATGAPGAPSLLFVVERQGRIDVLQNEQPVAAPFLDISKIVRGAPDVTAGAEQGLLSVAFPPDYQQSGRFYVYFTGGNNNPEIDEFQRSATNPLQANPNSRRKILTINHPIYTNHNGGQLQFGPDGYLYAATGDGGGTPAGKPSRDLNSLLGKLLRIDPHKTLLSAYSSPPDNPYVGRAGKDEIYAYGFRNPWRFSFDGSNLTLADVGAGAAEEVNVLPLAAARGANFGWPQYEGNLLHDASRPGADPPTFPMLTYPHTGGRCAVTGGYVVHDPNLPSLAGRYVYADFCTGELRSFLPDVANQQALDDQPLGVPPIPNLTSFGQGSGGQIYFTVGGGGLYRLTP